MKTYLVFDKGSGLLKIGKADCVDSRLKALQIGCGSILQLMHVFDYDIEYILHIEYSEKRVQGEWFDVDYRDVLSLVEDKGYLFEIGKNQNKDGVINDNRYEYLLKKNQWIRSIKIGGVKKIQKDINFDSVDKLCNRYSEETGKHIKAFRDSMVVTRIK